MIWRLSETADSYLHHCFDCRTTHYRENLRIWYLLRANIWYQVRLLLLARFQVHQINEAGLTLGAYFAMQRHANSDQLLGLGCRALVCLCSDLWHTAGAADDPPGSSDDDALWARNVTLQLLQEALPQHPDDRRLRKYCSEAFSEAELAHGHTEQQPWLIPEGEAGAARAAKADGSAPSAPTAASVVKGWVAEWVGEWVTKAAERGLGS